MLFYFCTTGMRATLTTKSQWQKASEGYSTRPADQGDSIQLPNSPRSINFLKNLQRFNFVMHDKPFFLVSGNSALKAPA